MTEREAWQRLANGAREGHVQTGLCPALRARYSEWSEGFNAVPVKTLDSMLRRIGGLRHNAGLWVWDRKSEDGQKARAAYCDRQVARLTRKRSTKPKPRKSVKR